MSQVQVDPASPLAEYVQWYTSSLMAANKSPATRQVYVGSVSTFDRFLADNGMPRELKKIKRTHVEAFMQDQLARLKPASAATRYAGIRSFFTWAAREGEITESPMSRMGPPKVPETQVKTLSPDEVERLIRACDGTSLRQRRDAALIRFMVDTGVRRTEAANITLDDLDQQERICTIRQGKGGKDRVVPYSYATQQAIFRYLQKRQSHTRASSPALWLGQVGPLRGDAVAQIVATRSKKAGVLDHDGTPLHAHQLRHTFADRSLRGGMSEGALMQLGGWASADVMRKYARDQARTRAIEEARRIFGEGAS